VGADDLIPFIEEQRRVNEVLRQAGRQITPPGTLSADTIRRARKEGQVGFPPIVLDERSEELLIDGQPPVPVRRHPNDDAATLFVHVHGGGWVFGSPEEMDRPLAELAPLCRSEIYSVDYRLAPEHPFPAARDDVATVIGWALAEAERRRLNGVIVGGESTGAQVALSAVLHLGPARLVAGGLRGLSLAFGFFDLGLSDSAQAWGEEYLAVSTPWLEWFVDQYLPGVPRDDRRDPVHSPSFASLGDLEDLPPVLIVVGNNDPLLDDSLDLADRLDVCGVAVDLHVYPEAPHGFIGLPTAMGRHGRRRIADWISDRGAESSIT